MIYVKSVFVGLAAMFVAAIIDIGVIFARLEVSSPAGTGGIVGPGWPILAISLLAFAAGFLWQYRRAVR
jgi:hypothetical protein